MKKHGLWKIAVATMVLILIFASCHHDTKKDTDKPKVASPLNLKNLFIHGKRVLNGKIELKTDKILQDDIEAHFSYGNVDDEEIQVTLKDSPFVLDKTKETILHISVAEKKDTYQAYDMDVTVSYREDAPSQKLDLITKVTVTGSNENGVEFTATQDEIEKLKQDEDFLLKMKGPRALLLIGSNKATWTKCEIDSQNVQFAPHPSLGFKSVAFVAIPLGKEGEITEHKIIVEAGTEKRETLLRIKRLKGTVDIPYCKLIVVNSDVITKDNLPKLCDGVSKPIFKGTEPCHIEVRCENEMIANCVIDESSPINMSKKTVSGKEVYVAEHSVTGVSPDGKDVTVVINPKDNATYHKTTWVFHLNYQAAVPMNVIYTFNNKPRRLLDGQFVKDLEDGKKPTLVLENASFFNMKFFATAKLSEVMVNNDTFTESSFIEKGVGHIFNHSIPVTTKEKDIKITFIPKDKGKHATKVFEFKVKGDGNKEKLSPTLFINNNNAKDFPNAFMDNLTNNTKPLHKVFRSPAKLEVYVDEYTYTFLSNSIKVNKESISIQEEKEKAKTFYIARKAINVTDTTPIDVEIEFVPKTANMIDSLNWKFQVQGGAEKPVFPKDKIPLFTINGVGGFGDALPKELLDNLTTNTPYTYTIDTDKAVIEVGWYKDTNDMLQHAIFEVDGTSTTVEAVKRSNAYICSHAVQLQGQTESSIKIKMVPKDDVDYKELVYNFKIKNSGQKPRLPLKFWVEKFSILDGGKKELDTDMPIIGVTSEEKNDEEIMDEVTINTKKIKIKKKVAENGLGFFYEAETAVDISTTDYTTVDISVTPKDPSKYRVTTCQIKLKAKQALPKDNGEFDFDGGGKQRVLFNIEWVDKERRDADNDHGAKSAVLTFFTKSPHAKVKYKCIFTGQNKDGEVVFESDLTSYKEAEHIGNEHITERIALDKDMPVTIKAEVVPEASGASADPDKGIYYFTFNPVIVLWDYSEGNDHSKYANTIQFLEDASGVKTPVIKIEKSKIPADKRIYLALSSWKADYGCNVGDTSKFSPLDEDGDIQWYKASIDVSSLNSNADEVLVSFPLLFNNKPSFTYKLKIKLQ